MQISRKDIPSLLDAHLSLDGDPKNPNKFTAKTRYAFAKNTRLLTTAFKDIEKARLGIIRAIAPTTFEIKKDTPEAIEFTKQWEPFDAGVEEVELFRFTLGDLNLDVNPIPINALAKLGPVIIEDSAPPAAA